MSARRFELLKDLPDVDKGEIYTLSGDRYYPQERKSPVIEENSYFTWQVENNPTWFKEVLDKEWERIHVQRLRKHDSFLGNKVDTYWYQFNSYPKPLDETKFPAIKKAVEQIVNNDADKMFIEALSMFDKEPFIWTDELVYEYGVYNTTHPWVSTNLQDFKASKQLSSSTPSGTANGVLNTDEKKEPESLWGDWLDDMVKNTVKNTPQPQNNKERITVDIFPSGSDCLNGMYAYSYATSTRIPKETFPAIKQAIEQVLNDEVGIGKEELFKNPDGSITTFPKAIHDTDSEKVWMTRDYFNKIMRYQYNQYKEEDLRKAFNASREKNITGDEYDEGGVPHLKYKTFEDYKNKL